MSTDLRHVLAGWVIDGNGGAICKDVLISFCKGRISSLTPGYREALPQKTMDFRDCTMLPGLMDAHVHLNMSASSDPDERRAQLSHNYLQARKLIQKHLDQHLIHGIVAVRDGGDAHGHVQRFCRQHGDRRHLPMVQTAGRGWHADGRYGALVGRSVAPEALAREVAADTSPGDHLKVVNSGLVSLTEFGRCGPAQFAPQQLQQAVRAAAKPVMVHANFPSPVAGALQAHCDSIEHGYFMGDANLQQMAEKQVFWVPTAGTMQGLALKRDHRAGTPEVVRRNLEAQLQQLRKACKWGLPVVLGTDAGCTGVDHGSAVITEMRLFMAAGYTLSEVVQAATGHAARLLGLENGGRIAVGCPATWVLVPQDPDHLPDRLGAIKDLFVDGRRVRIGKRRNPQRSVDEAISPACKRPNG